LQLLGFLGHALLSQLTGSWLIYHLIKVFSWIFHIIKIFIILVLKIFIKLILAIIISIKLILAIIVSVLSDSSFIKNFLLRNCIYSWDYCLIIIYRSSNYIDWYPSVGSVKHLKSIKFSFSICVADLVNHFQISIKLTIGAVQLWDQSSRGKSNRARQTLYI